MQDEDRAGFVTVTTALAATFGREADRALLEGYWLGLSDLSLEAVESACAAAIRQLEFFPRPAQLRRLAGAPQPEKRAALAWIEVSAASRSSSWPSDPVAAEVVRHMGGPQRLGMMNTEDFETWGRKEFERIYAALAESEEVRGRLAAAGRGRPEGPAAELAAVLADKKAMSRSTDKTTNQRRLS